MPEKKADKVDKRSLPFYLVVTPIDELLDDERLEFVGDSRKEQYISATDFTRIRDIIQRFKANLTEWDLETLKRCLESCVQIRNPEKPE